MRRLIALLLFLLLVNEGDSTALYAQPTPIGFSPTGFAPFGWVQPLLLDALPIEVRAFDIVVLVLLVVAASKASARSGQVRPMRNVLFLGVATTIASFAYGVATGGSVRFACWQAYLLLSAILFAFTVAALFVTPAHYESLAKWIVAAAIYRAVMCWFFYFVYIRGGPSHFEHDGAYVTTHHDTVLWLVALFAVLAHALNERKVRTSVSAALISALLLGAIQWNTRRLAWVSLAMAVLTAFFLLPKGRARARMTRAALIAAPILALYVAVGWGRSERIFLPLRSLSSVTEQQDNSSKARIAENLGLIATVRKAGAAAGTGYGHAYIELTTQYSIRTSMELSPYVPHNSILGFLAYTGALGFAGYWLAIPTAVFLNARLAKRGKTQQLRNIGFVCCMAIVVCCNQMYGDMGSFSEPTMYLLALTYAVAMRLPISSGAWPPTRSRAPAASPAPS